MTVMTVTAVNAKCRRSYAFGTGGDKVGRQSNVALLRECGIT
jgi:hypothetical protein